MRSGLLASGVLAALSLAYAASGASAQEARTASRIIDASCTTTCHTVRRIETAAMDGDGWTKTVNTMIEKGAKVSAEEVPVLVTYLARNHGPVPDGPGKAILLNTCTMCHDLRRIKQGRRSAEEWEETLVAMLNEGAPLPDDQFPIIHDYLSRHFGVE